MARSCRTTTILTLLLSWRVATGLDVVLVKVGGSSITHKATKETVNLDAINWFAKRLSSAVGDSFKVPSTGEATLEECTESRKDDEKAFIVIHGAGSFGHHSAKEFGLSGKSLPPTSTDESLDAMERRRMMQGVAETKLSVQKLNRILVSSLVEHGINAVGISPCMSIPGLQAHGADQVSQGHLFSSLQAMLKAGLVPVLHGDACLYGTFGAGILSGDTLMEIIGVSSLTTEAIFLTDVDGIFTKDPRTNPDAELLRTIEVDPQTTDISIVGLEASGSSHEHDVTGGLKTKLASALAIAVTGTNVTVARCGSESAARALRRESNIDLATVLYSNS